MWWWILGWLNVTTTQQSVCLEAAGNETLVGPSWIIWNTAACFIWNDYAVLSNLYQVKAHTEDSFVWEPVKWQFRVCDLRPVKSNQFILEGEWAFVPSLKKKSPKVFLRYRVHRKGAGLRSGWLWPLTSEAKFPPKISRHQWHIMVTVR